MFIPLYKDMCSKRPVNADQYKWNRNLTSCAINWPEDFEPNWEGVLIISLVHIYLELWKLYNHDNDMHWAMHD